MKKILAGVIFSNFTAAGLSFGLNVTLARLLEPAEYGKIALIFATVMVLYSLLDFGFNTTQVVVTNKLKKYSFIQIQTWVNKLYKYWLLLTSLIGFSAVFFIGQYYNYSEIEQIAIYLPLIGYTVTRYIQSRYQASSEWSKFNQVNILNAFTKALAILLAVGLGYFFAHNWIIFDYVIYGYVIYPIGITCLLIILFKNTSKAKSEFSNDPLPKDFVLLYAKTMLPLGLSAVMVIVIMRADVFFIEYYLSLDEVGIYNAANSLALVFPLLTTSLLNVFIQKASGRNSDFLKEYIYNQKKLLIILPVVYFTLMTIAPTLFQLVYGTEYAGSSDIYMILLIAYIGGVYFTPIESYFYAHRPSLILKLRILQLASLLLLFVFLLDKYGLLGCAFAIVLIRVLTWCVVLPSAIKEIKSND